MHIADNEDRIKFMILIIGLWAIPPWRDVKKKKLEEWYQYWRKLIDQITCRKQVVTVYVRGLDNLFPNTIS